MLNTFSYTCWAFVSIQVLCPFYNQVIGFCAVELQEFLYVFWRLTSYQKNGLQVFSLIL